jgi:hypothetical protein
MAKKIKQAVKPMDVTKVMRKARRDAELARGGRPRAWTAPDGRKEAARKACRGRVA